MPFDNNHLNVFLAFGKNFQGGATVAAGDVLGDAQLKSSSAPDPARATKCEFSTAQPPGR